MSTEKGKKFDDGKPKMSLLEPHYLRSISRVLTFGATKYGAYNWQNNLEKERIVSALYRHLTAYHSGERFDPETGENHMAHIGCNAMFLFWYDQVKPTVSPVCQRCNVAMQFKNAICKACKNAARRFK